MNYRGKQRSTCSMSLLAASLFLAIGMLPSLAWGQSSESMMRYLPSQSQAVMGLNIPKLSKSKYFDKLLKFGQSKAGGRRVIELLEKDAALNLQKDIDAMAVSIPASGMKRSGKRPPFTTAISGSFDNDKLLEVFKKAKDDLESSKHDKLKVYSTGTFRFTFPKAGLMWITSGPSTYRKKAFAALDSKKHSVRANTSLRGLVNDVDTSKGFWMVLDTSTLAAAKSAGKSRPKNMGLSADIYNGLALDMFAGMPTKQQAASTLAKIKQFTSQSNGTQTMLAMFGAGPLLANLKAKQTGKKLQLSTHMSAPQFDTLVQKVTKMVKARMQNGAMPIQPVPSTSQPVPSKGKSDGANADFN